jgi:hypothetical protein
MHLAIAPTPFGSGEHLPTAAATHVVIKKREPARPP